MELAADLALIALIVVGISRFRTPGGASFGNHAAALAIVVAGAHAAARAGVADPGAVTVAVLAGALAGVAVAYRARTTSLPAVIALQHGIGGLAAVLVSALELAHGRAELELAAKLSGLFGLVLGATTFSASLVAAAKLGNLIRREPTVVPHHDLHLFALGLLIGVFAVQYGVADNPGAHVVAIVVGAMVLGALFAVRVGGPDLPVLVSVLNAAAGLAAAFCGVAIANRLLVVAGAIVAASGSILTVVTCRALHRSLPNVFFGGAATSRADADPLAAVAELARAAHKVIVVPGYGMARARAHVEVARLARLLEAMGKDVRFALHPLAGRMPDHMNLLLAEAGVADEELLELEDANCELPTADLVLVVGANDVVNPAALDVPVLHAFEARAVVVCNLDERPGHAGVANPLYRAEHTTLLLGDAAATVQALCERLEVPARDLGSLR
ncbi:MAG: NAD(P)(+) transhydrogenase (Re/Si-specific) subunit beta [Deltaproteobacteria bacterium]|nr:NAD(P)(+) transhydrogenase (Re/Si-specific) subunit beta [Deltaproteobacteria bacterium]